MNQYAVYTPSGHISRVYSGPEDEAALQPQDDEQVMLLPEGLDDTTAYVSNSQVLEKQPFQFTIDKFQVTANGMDEVIITNIPAGAIIYWPDSQTDEVTDGEVRFSVDLIGTYTLTFTAVPYLDQEVVIEAVAAA